MYGTGIFVIILFAAVFASYKFGKLTFLGSLTGGLVAIAIYAGTRMGGIALLGAFFLLGTLATAWHKNLKQQLTGEGDKQTRNAAQVLANGGVAALLGIWAFVLPAHASAAYVMMAAAFASATADTLSSELGTVYGRRFYNIITLKKDERGRDGVVSVEGTLIGVAGAVIIAFIYAACTHSWGMIWLIIVAGTIGNLTDSVLGATLERRGAINNEVVNFLNTAVAALALWLML